MAHSTDPPPAADSLRRDIAAIVGIAPGEIAGDDNLVLLGLGSLEVMRLVTRWRRQGLVVDFAEMAAVPTVDAWADRLRAAWAAGNATGTPR